MKLLAGILLASGLFLGSADTSDLSNEISNSEQIDQSVENNEENNTTNDSTAISSEEQVEQTEFQKLLEQWLNGEIELDDITIEKIYEKLSPVAEEELDKVLQKYIEDSEERQKVVGVLMAVLGATLSFLAMLIFTKGIKKENVKANINNETFSKTSKLLATAVEESKDDIKKLREITESNQQANEKTQQLLVESLESLERKFNAVMGVLEIVYNKEGANDEKATQE